MPESSDADTASLASSSRSEAPLTSRPRSPFPTTPRKTAPAPAVSTVTATARATATASRYPSVLSIFPDAAAAAPLEPFAPHAGPSRANSFISRATLDPPATSSPSRAPSRPPTRANSRRNTVSERWDGVEGSGAGSGSGVTGELAVVGDAREGLRDLKRLADRPGLPRAPSGDDTLVELAHDSGPERSYSARRYFVLTHAGKPVFCSSGDTDDLTNITGVAQALISIFAADDDRIRCIVKGKHRIAFLLKVPLYLFCVSDWGEPEHVLRMHLDYIHLQIISVVSSTQLERVFQRRSNFDLSRLLEGTDPFLHHLLERCQADFSFLTSTLQPLRMAPALRDTAAAALMPPAKLHDLLYVLLVADGKIVTLLRPRKHSIHPSDLHLLLNTLATSATLRASETWLPICLPKFNPAGFVHAYVSYVLPDVGLVFVSADREAFDSLQAWRRLVVEHLEKDSSLGKIQQAISAHSYTVAAVGCPGLRHFVYKSRPLVQVTAPEWDDAYAAAPARRRLVTLFHRLHDAVHARSGQASTFKLVYLRAEHEACLAWITKPFELYIAVSPHLSKSAVVGAANAVAKWVAAEESRLFLKDAPVF
ncbi:Vacuolar fusion protein mon1 [Cryptotrichosporon argae]